jgi:hypothetical protein
MRSKKDRRAGTHPIETTVAILWPGAVIIVIFVTVVAVRLDWGSNNGSSPRSQPFSPYEGPTDRLLNHGALAPTFSVEII